MTTEYLASEKEANRIGPLEGGMIPIAVIELMCENKLHFADVKVYHYCILNEDIHRSRTHKLDPKRIAEFTGLALRSVNRSLGNLCKLGILHERKNPHVYDMPLSASMRAKLKNKTTDSRERQIQDAVERRVKGMEKNGSKVTPTVRNRIEQQVRQRQG